MGLEFQKSNWIKNHHFQDTIRANFEFSGLNLGNCPITSNILVLIVLTAFKGATISFIIFKDFSTFRQVFLSPQVKRWAIITYKHCIYELPQELKNGLRLWILGN